jgi:3-methyladenine DNA glycosylase AlkD
MIATLRYVRRGHFVDAIRLCERLLGDMHDLMHKAVGWVLREIADRQEALLRDFLRAHGPQLPRTSLRYAIEHLPEADRRVFMAVKARPPASLRG